MQDFTAAFTLAFRLVASGNADLVEIVVLSLRVSLTAVLFAGLIGLPLGAALAVAPNLAIAWNDPVGDWTLTVTDIATGVATDTSFQVQARTPKRRP